MLQKRVLVVEDDDAIRELVKLVAAKSGFAVNCAANGAEAIAALDRGTYSALVLDLMMPTVDGYDVLSHLKEKSISVPVIVMTAAVRAVRDERLDRTLVKTVLTKPFEIDALSAALMAACAGESTHEP